MLIELSASMTSLCSVSLLSVNRLMEETYGMPYTNPYFFLTIEPNRMGFR